MTIHVVQPGETLYGIAGRYGADPELLRQANGAPENGALAVGQTLVIQEIRLFHVVQPGQTLASIARRILQEDGRFGRILETKAGCTIFCHSGPGTLGVVLLRK